MRRRSRHKGRAGDVLIGFVRSHAFHVLLGLFLLALVFLGGSSRYDRIAQVPIRLVAIAVLIWATFRSAAQAPRAIRGPAILLGAAILLVCIQLIPLPPMIWAALPGRSGFTEVAALAGFAQPWRPLAIAPDLAVNSLLSLTIPAATLHALSVLDPKDSRRAYSIVLGVIAFALLIGMVQIITGSGVITSIYQMRTGPGASGIFANRNHQALLLAIGIPLLLGSEGLRRTGGPATFFRWGSGIFLVMLVIGLIATGSRAGVLLGAIGLFGALAVFWSWFRSYARLERRPFWLIAAGLAVIVLLVGAAVIFFGRGEAIDRLVAVDPMGDKRVRTLPVVLDVLWTYFPAGSGFGSFDTVFRRAEPFGLLEGTYFNQAHDDLIQVILEGGIPGLLLVVAAIGWLAVAGYRLWRSDSARGAAVRGRAASVALILMLAASAVDYPLRTPTMMALACVLIFQVAVALDHLRERAAVSPDGDQDLALPASDQRL